MTNPRSQAGATILVIGLSVLGVAVLDAQGPVVHLEPFATEFRNPIGIDFYEPVDGVGRLIMSVNYPTGSPNNLDLVELDGSREPFSTLANEPDELKVATVRNGPCTGGFAVGTVFVGTGALGSVAVTRIDPSGVVFESWVQLPTDEAVVRGSLYQDRACSFGGDLIVVTGNPQEEPTERPTNLTGSVWRINSAGEATRIVHFAKHLEGVITLPNDPVRYGPLAGRIITGDEDFTFDGPLPANGPHGKIIGIKSETDIITVGAADPLFAAYPNYPTAIPLHPEDLELIGQVRPNLSGDGDLFAVDFGGGQVLRAPAPDFADKCGDVLVVQEFPDEAVPSGLSTLRWNGTSFDVTPLINQGSAVVGHFEHVSFRGGADCVRPNVRLTKEADDGSITVGDVVSFQIVVTNDGPGDATNLLVSDPLPAGLEWTIDQPSTCAIAAGELRCAIASLAEGEAFSVRVSASTAGMTVNPTALLTGGASSSRETSKSWYPMTGKPPVCREVTNTATVGASNEDTTRLDDNTATATVTVCESKPPHKKRFRHVGHRKVHYAGDGCRLEELDERKVETKRGRPSKARTGH